MTIRKKIIMLQGSGSEVLWGICKSSPIGENLFISCGALEESNDGCGMVRVWSADALFAYHRAGEVDRISSFRQRQAARSCLLCRRSALARAGCTSERDRGLSILRRRRVAGGISWRPAAVDR